MIILISGNSCTGKTYMAQQLLERYHVPYLSIDHLKMGLYRADMNCGFTPLDSTEFIGEKLWPILKGIIKTNIENNQNLIIEGCYILPHHLQDIEPSYSAHIIPVFLGFSTTYIQQNFQSNIIQHRNAIETRMYPEEGTVTDYIQEHDAFREKCLATAVPYFEIKENYEEEISKVYDYIEGEKQRIAKIKHKS
ncbi:MULTISPECIES: AAA family ATPase [Paenibacillus]|uniref:2-phosphoglycerate kinase n=1 Tax=Paenibacillus lautus TaxID=1401 RepID=A0A1R1B646_PAELA|nr:2-phosphoglycerate kinase [Paenibacillus lautus]OME95043.1 2-phosphoglycerate kinase [Paenibacillus lautus]